MPKRGGGSGIGGALPPAATPVIPPQPAPATAVGDVDPELGTVVHVYPNGTIAYEKLDVELPAEQATNQLTATSAVVNAFLDFYESQNPNTTVRFSDVDYDETTGNVTVWVQDSNSLSGLAKAYYQTHVYGTRKTWVKADGDIYSTYSDTKYSFNFKGANWY